MAQNLILVPVVLQVLLTLAVLVHMGRMRSRSMRRRRQSMDDLALAGPADWDVDAQKASNNFKNQFELPLLFYVACMFALVTRNIDLAMMMLALVFVASRVAHSVIHLGANRVAPRFTAYAVGLLALVAMWGLLMWRVAWAGF